MSERAPTWARMAELLREFKCVKRAGYIQAPDRPIIYLEIKFKWYTWLFRWKRREVWSVLEAERPVGISFRPIELAMTWLDLSETER